MPGLGGDTVSRGVGCIPLEDPPGSLLPATHIHCCPVPVLLVDVQLFEHFVPFTCKADGVREECLSIMEELGPLVHSSREGIYMANLAPVPLETWAAGEPFCMATVCHQRQPICLPPSVGAQLPPGGLSPYIPPRHIYTDVAWGSPPHPEHSG